MMSNKSPRIGRQVRHIDALNSSSIVADFSPCRKFRYSLSFQYKRFKRNLFDEKNFEQRSKTMTVILKNPSSADEKAADNTINRVENYVFKNFQDVLKVNILNLFAIRATDAVEVNDVYKATGKEDVVGPENDQSFEKYIKEADYIITAWGGRSQINRKLYDSRIKEVLEILKKSKKEMTPIYRVNPKKGSVHYPFHACFWSVFFEKEFVDVNILNSLE